MVTPWSIWQELKGQISFLITGQIRIIQNGSLQQFLFDLSGIYELKYMFLK